MRWAWAAQSSLRRDGRCAFFEPAKIWIALTIFLGFDLLFAIGFALEERLRRSSIYLGRSGAVQALFAIGAAFALANLDALRDQPARIFLLVLVSDLCLLFFAAIRMDLLKLVVLAAGIVFAFLVFWLQRCLSPQTFYWGLAAILVFALLHSLFPLWLQKRRPTAQLASINPYFGLGGLLLMVVGLLNLKEVSFLVWPVVLVIDLLVLVISGIASSLIAVLGAIALTLLLAAVWVFKIQTDATDGLIPLLLVVGAFALMFFGASFWLERKLFAGDDENAEARRAQSTLISASAAMLPFLLIALVIVRFPLENPSPLFTLGLLLFALMFCAAVRVREGIVLMVGAGGVFLTEWLWHQLRFAAAPAGNSVAWYLAFYLTLTFLPFIRTSAFMNGSPAWIASALAGPVHFALIYAAAKRLLPDFGFMGIVPGLMILPPALCFLLSRKLSALADPLRRTVLALFAGSTLFFVTLIFPIQFERQWLTISWALEGVALLWLFRRIPHEGLRVVGTGLLVVAFLRLAVNPEVFHYYPRSGTRIVNWYLYSYGIVTAALLLAGRLSGPPLPRLFNQNIQALFYTLGTMLAFILLNIEIADFFGNSQYLEFEFSGNFARDMTYSIAWALFALGLLIVGIRQKVKTIRYTSLGLLCVTLAKLFLHDLSQLNQLYRIGAFIGVAIILIFCSWLYQRFLAAQGKTALASNDN